MIPLVLFATAFLVRVVIGAAFSGPAYPDSYYYVHVAQQLAAGHGFVTDYVWNLDDIGGQLLSGAGLPIPANGFWMPLAEIVQLPFISVLGTAASGIPFWIIGALGAPLTYWIGRDAGLQPGPAAAAGLMVAVPAGLTPFMAQPDNFALTMVLGALALWLCSRAMNGDRRAFVLGGLVVGLATLARTDAIVLGLPYAWLAIRALVHRARGRNALRERIGPLAILGAAGLFALVLAPWLYRQLGTYGTLLPSGGGRVLWLTDYQQFFSATNVPTFDTWAAQGPFEIVLSRVRGLLSAVGIFALLPLAVVLAPFAAAGAWLRRADAAFQPFLIYALAVFAINALLFAVLVTHGTFLHAAAALVPHTFLLVIVGVKAAVDWVARRRRGWDAVTAVRVFTAASVAVTFIAAGLQTVNVTRNWARERALNQRIAAAFGAADPTDRFMAADPGAINYLTGRQGLVTPNDDLGVIEAAMRAYDVRWLVLERDDIVPALRPVLAGTVQPAWLSRPVAVVDATPAAVASSGPVPNSIPGAALFAVCLSADDTRCAQ